MGNNISNNNDDQNVNNPTKKHDDNNNEIEMSSKHIQILPPNIDNDAIDDDNMMETFKSSVKGKLYVNPLFNDTGIFDIINNDPENNNNNNVKRRQRNKRKSIKLIKANNQKAKCIIPMADNMKNVFLLLCGSLLFYCLIFVLVLFFSELSIDKNPISFLFLSFQFNFITLMIIDRYQDVSNIEKGKTKFLKCKLLMPFKI